LNQKIRTPDQPQDRAAHSELLPWLCHVATDWVLCKDGSLLAGFDYTGLDIDNADEHNTPQVLGELQRAIAALDERFYLWWTVDKRRELHYRQSEFGSEAARRIDAGVGAQFERGEMFTLVYRLFIVYTGETGMFAYMDNVRRLVNDDNRSVLAALLLSLNPSAMSNAAVLHDARQLDQNLMAARGGVLQFLSAHSVMQFRQLGGWDLDNALLQAANLTVPTDTAYQPSPAALLDGYCALSDIKIGREVASISGPNRSMFAAQLTLKNYPESASVGSMEILLAMPMEFRLTHVMRCMGQDTARKTLKEIAEHYLMTQSTFFQRAIAKATGKPAAIDPGKEDMYAECVEALRRQNFEGLNWLHHAMTITLIESSVEALEHRVNDVSRTVNQVPFIRERIGLKASLAAVLPGNWAAQKRLMFVNAQLACDCAPVFTMAPGSASSTHLSETYGKPVPSMAVLRTVYGTAYHLNPHSGQVGHALLVMPTGGGKTTFANFCLAQFNRYPGSQVVIFDRNLSCRIITGQVGGTHIDLASGSIKLNPMAAIREGDMGRLWAREWLLQRLQEGGMVTSAEDRNDIDATFLQLAGSTQSLTLSTIAHLMPRHIHTAMMEWLQGGPYGMFDHEVDDLSLTDWTCIEMKDLMAVERLARAFLDHAFRMITKRLDGRPTFIYLEEASFLLNSASFLPTLDTWLKTLRKLNAFVWMTIQSPETVSGIDDERIRATLADNIPNLFLGYNKRLENHRDLYKHMFAMTDAQVNQLAQIRPKRDYLLLQDGICKVMCTNFSKDMLAYLRSELVFQDLFTQAQASGRVDWREWYIQEALRKSS
jgi:type IV secretion system protein TrbE